MKEKLSDSETKVMNILWKKGEPMSAKEIAAIATERIGWSKNTTYTVINKLVNNGVIKREEPNFICTALVSKNEMQKSETAYLMRKLFDGSRRAMFSALIEEEPLTENELEELKKLIDGR